MRLALACFIIERIRTMKYEEWKKLCGDVLFGRVDITSITDNELLSLTKSKPFGFFGPRPEMPPFDVFVMAGDEITRRRKERIKPKRQTDTFFTNLVDNMDFDTVKEWAATLQVQVTEPDTDNEYPDWEDGVRVEVAEAMGGVGEKLSNNNFNERIVK
jgi:hypothetical protein